MPPNACFFFFAATVATPARNDEVEISNPDVSNPDSILFGLATGALEQTSLPPKMKRTFSLTNIFRLGTKTDTAQKRLRTTTNSGTPLNQLKAL